VSLSRRHFVTTTLAVPLLAQPAGAALKFVIAGGHPGDPECGCAGTIVRLTELGHEVVVLYLNRGEGYCGSASLDRCAEIRTTEAQNACRILKARATFAGQIDGRATVDAAHYDTFARALAAETPDAVFTQWPIDVHPDHRAISALSLEAWLKSGRKFALYYYEVAEDTMMFTPTDYVDISTAESRRRAACYAHVSQQPDKWYPRQVEITRRRGVESGHGQAEAFAHHPESRRIALP
jgi:LmbE family N-acetylglucosaminyl deacetylase